MLLFSRNKTAGVQAFMLKLANTHCPELRPLSDNRRKETRVPFCAVVLVVPLENGTPQLGRHFPAVTRDLCTRGVSIVLDQPRGLRELLIGFRWENDMKFLRGNAKHLNPMGAGFFRLGIELSEVVSADEYPELESLHISRS